ncbi:MAG: WYL domain-containing protein [Verrucomicrobiae bacterium]|nr:WYL domain-containing protein [Verrucomicrobiae bacterium]
MGNTTNRDQWAGRERLLFIERAAWWRGMVNRQDLRAMFGISAAQSSADLQGYQELNPGALAYNLKSKRYEARPEMTCALHTPTLDEAVSVFWGASPGVPRVAADAGKVAIALPPQRRADVNVERRVFLAIEQGKSLFVRYRSVSGKSGKRREIAPHALGHDGLRWHARAWCFENGEYRDFVLGRMEEAEWPEEVFQAPEPDAAWETRVTLVFRANQELDEPQRNAIERDYGMTAGRLEITVREAMREYVLAQLRIPADDGARPRHLDLVE